MLRHSMDPAATKVLSKMNVDIWNICNNHIMDLRERGMLATLEEAKKQGVNTIGAGMNIEEARKPVILDEAGGIGIFAVGYRYGCWAASEEKAGCLNWNELDIIEENIREIKKSCRWCIVVAHAGEEFTSLPSPYTRDMYMKYLEMGADIIVCHHPHVPMNYELLGDKAIFYSLGNFIFDTDYQRAQFNTEKGVLLKLCFTQEAYTFEPMGIRIERGVERVVKGDIPAIFQNVPAEEYELLAPLAAKNLIASAKRRQIFMKPEDFANASEEKWQEELMNPNRRGRVQGESLDFEIIMPLAEREKEKAWQESKLEAVKQYILEQL